MEAANTEELYIFIPIEFLRRSGMARLHIGRGWDKGFNMIGKKRLK